MRRLMLLLAIAGLVRADDSLTLDFKDTNAAAAVGVVATYSGAKIVLDPEFQAARLTLKVDGAGVADCLSKVAVAIGARLFYQGDTYHIVTAWRFDLLKALHDGQRMTLAFENESVRKLLSLTATYAGVSMVLDPQLGDPKPTVKLTNATVAEALTKMLAQNDAGYDLRYGALFVATKKRLAALPKHAPIKLPERLRKERVLISVDGESGARILASFAGKARLTLDIAKEIEPALGKRNMTMHLIDVPIEHALAAVLAPAGAKAEIVGEKLIVTKG